MNIRDLISRRSDLSTFVVHLARNHTNSAKDNLLSILAEKYIKAHSPFGHACSKLKTANRSTKSQKCVCFTETPLEYLHLLLGDIEGRSVQLEPYGIAVTKRVAQTKGVNPIWYVDISPNGQEWLSNSINNLVDKAIQDGTFDNSDIAKLTPFIEQMGSKNSGKSYRKEFWWEREWRCCGDFTLPRNVIIICPESEHNQFDEACKNANQKFSLIDAQWGLEQIIARLAGFDHDEIQII